MELYKKTLARYKFYLSLENALCRDYITEKLFLAMHARTLPIAFGGLDKREYLKVVPPHSFIYAEDFKSTRELADYLTYLSQNETAYNSYFWWIHDYHIETIQDEQWRSNCDLCQALNEQRTDKSGKYSKFGDFDEYWQPKHSCRTTNMTFD